MLTLAIAVVVVCVVASVFFSAIYLSLLDLTRSTAEALARTRGPAAVSRVEKILHDVSGHARSVALGRIAANLLALVALVWVVAGLEDAILSATQAGAEHPHPLLVHPRHGAIAFLIGAVLMWLVSVVIPQAWARHAGERLVVSFSRLIRGAYVLLRPFAPIEHGLDRLVRKLAGRPEVSDTAAELEAELLSVVDEGERQGQFDEDTAHMIENIVRLRETSVGQVMTPRREIEALELTSNLGAITAFVRKARHSRIPVYRAGGGLDDVVGFFYVKDLLKWLSGGGDASGAGGGHKPFDLKSILRPALFVPETKNLRDAAHELIDKRVHVAMVADEYGGTAGIVSLEDIIEEVFGEIQDEYEIAADEPPRIELKAGEFNAEVDARAYVEDVNQAIEAWGAGGAGVQLPESDEYDTVGGLVTTLAGRIPEVNESFEAGPLIVTVLEATPMRVVSVRVALSPAERRRREESAAPERAESSGTPAGAPSAAK